MSPRPTLLRLVPLALLASHALASHAAPLEPGGGCPTITPHPSWKTSVGFPSDPFQFTSFFTAEPGWVKFTVQTCDPDTVYFQNSVSFPFHYDWAKTHFDPFVGFSLQQFESATLFEQGREAWLGAVVVPPTGGFPTPPPLPEYGIQLVGSDPLPIGDVITLLDSVRDSVNAPPSVQALYFPTFEQAAVAQENQALLLSHGYEISSPGRWVEGNSCYSHGWALGTLKFIPAEDIEEAFATGALAPTDVLLTDGVPNDVPLVAAILSLVPATPNSHVAILADTFDVPFVHVGDSELEGRALSLVGSRVGVKAFLAPFSFGECTVRLIDASELTQQQTDEVLAYKVPPPLSLQPIAPFGGYAQDTDVLGQADIDHFGGKASNYGILRRAIPNNCPRALGLSFDLWTEFLGQPFGGSTLRRAIDAKLSQHSYPPADMPQLVQDLSDIRGWIEDELATSFTPSQQTAVKAVLQSAPYNFDPFQNIRFRSSTNVEDSEMFTGAGLYDSNSGCLQDDLDADATGPSWCDSGEDDEDGVFEAIRDVYSSFYDLNAVLERLRHGVDESEVGMAVLVHHSYPDPFEAANGVATLERTNPSFTTIRLVSQVGAIPVTNPQNGVLPEDVTISVSGPSKSLTLVSSSNLVQLGGHVMTWQQDYVQLADLLIAASNRFALETGKTSYVLDFEYKKLHPGGAAHPPGGLVVKQLREIPQTDTTPTIPRFLVGEPGQLIVQQGGGALSTDAVHRLKSFWSARTVNGWVDQVQNVIDEATVVFNDGCHQALAASVSPDVPGPPDVGNNAVDGWSLGLGGASALTTTLVNVKGLSNPIEGPLVTLAELADFDTGGSVFLDAFYPQRVAWYDSSGTPHFVTQERVRLVQQYDDIAQDPVSTHVVNAPHGATIQVSYSLHPVQGICAGCIFPLSSWGETRITGLTTQPIVLTGELSRSYNAGNHNFFEVFVLEPRLDPNVTPEQLAQLAERKIDRILMFGGFFGWTVFYLDAPDCGPLGTPADWQPPARPDHPADGSQGLLPPGPKVP